MGALLEELRRLGYLEGKTIVIKRWSGGGNIGAYGALAHKIVNEQPQLIVARSRTMATALAAATREIPIVMVGTITSELSGSFARPNRNVTGINVSYDEQQIYAKQAEFLRDITGKNARIAWLGTQNLWEGPVGKAAREGARQAGLILDAVLLSSPVDEAAIHRAFVPVLAGRFVGMYVSPATELFPYRSIIAKLAQEARLPTIGNGRPWAEAGILLSYGANPVDMYRRAAYFVDRILRGAKPADLPIEQPGVIELVINLKTAKALGISIPPPLLVRADKLIE